MPYSIATETLTGVEKLKRTCLGKLVLSVAKFLAWTPHRARYDEAKPPKFTLALNILYGFAGAFSSANLYYTNPILNVLAKDFHVPIAMVANIPALIQVGYALGLIFICPLGDQVRRRPLVLGLTFAAATLTMGPALIPHLPSFQANQFFIGIVVITSQIMSALVGDLAAPERRASSLAIVTSSMQCGVIFARLISGIMTQYVSWRNVYWLSTAMQYLIFALLWLLMPDYPVTNKNSGPYYRLLIKMVQMFSKHPVLVQASVISFFMSAVFTSFWTSVTFLLSKPPFNFNPIHIAPFALVSVPTMLLNPVYSRRLTDRFTPTVVVFLALGYALFGVSMGMAIAPISIAGAILQAMFADFGRQTSQVANRAAIYAAEPTAKSSINTAYMFVTFMGQVTGTFTGAQLMAWKGWRVADLSALVMVFLAAAAALARGPRERAGSAGRGACSGGKKRW
ncbi:MFS general substrate transporter [Piedraia hortae CBS 480.64]|uniref:MFS general substrate transporter n=1 Tax=Piedraia hortae CBS 480.64 TaxID=1314780 RepID=A0A6A7BQF6_9PEZI|nr:MFS general substrate transporter [Piedraia hortae CBS 480.64]